MKLSVKNIKGGRTYKFGVYAGKSCLSKHKTEKQAIESLDSKRELYEYWAGSCSVAVDNSTKTYI